MPRAARKSLLLGVRIFTVAVVSTAAWNHRDRSVLSKDLEVLDSRKDGNLQVSTAELWQGNMGSPLVARPRFNRRTSLTGSVASNDSTTSIMTYVKNLQARLRPSHERDLYYASSPRRISLDQTRSPDISVGIESQIQGQALDTEMIFDNKGDFEVMTNAIDTEIISTDTGEIDDLERNTELSAALQYTDMNLGPVLYYQSTALFKSLAPLIGNSSEFTSSSRVLLEDLGRLHLWGAAFDEAQLNAILRESEVIRTTVLDLTFTLSRILVESKLGNNYRVGLWHTSLTHFQDVFPTLSQTYTNPKVDEQFRALKSLLQHTEQLLFGNIQEEQDLDEDQSPDGLEYSMEDAAFMIRSSVDCLMGLLPSMERVLASLESPAA
ncbi:hypothetical protein EG329_013532 [Mollisiaceae sp. DMI_Dod_QoI]|nr:hypothetical protein EG329_013532 [Helotiales sp. DMI_Dod_QoI]